jgi:hypothetical protein
MAQLLYEVGNNVDEHKRLRNALRNAIFTVLMYPCIVLKHLKGFQYPYNHHLTGYQQLLCP